MKLPYADEIRDARARSEEAQTAVMFLKRVQTAAHAVGILEAQVLRGIRYEGELPGDDELEEAALRIPAFGTREPAGSMAARLRSRSARLQQLMEVLHPIAAHAEEVAAELHQLQHQQHHELEQPEWAEAVASLNTLANTRDTYAKALGLLQGKLAMVQPVAGLLQAFVPQLSAELHSARTDEDERGIAAWRAARLSLEQLVGLAGLLERVGLVVQLPIEPAIPDEPHPRHRERLQREAQVVLEWMQALRDVLATHGAALLEQQERLTAEHRAAEDALKERMG